MAYLHNEPNVIIHRDLKPRSVYLFARPDWRYKVVVLLITWFCAYLVGVFEITISVCLAISTLGVVFMCWLNVVITFRNILLVNSSADHLKVGDFGLSKLIKVQNSHEVYKMTGETGRCKFWIRIYIFICLRL